MTKNNDNKNQQKRQPQNQHDELAKAQQQWHNDAEQLNREKANAGYGGISWQALLEIDPDTISDTEQQSILLDLQTRYQELQQQKETLWGEEWAIAELNKKHSIVHVEQTYVLTEKTNSLGHPDFSLESRQSFKAYYDDEQVQCFDGKWRSKADVWLKSRKKRKYKGIIFDPTRSGHTDEYYNLWRGFAFTPQPRGCTHEGTCSPECSLFWQHVRDNICSGKEEAYRYLRKWLAYVFQHPDETHTAIVLCGSQGTGKNTFVDTLGTLLGGHYAPLSNIHELTSNFNYHLKHAVLIHANEALWGGNKKDIGAVKAMITEEKCMIEGKCKDRVMVRNFRHLIISSNEDWPVHIDPDDRRFCVLQVSDQHKEDHAYFEQIQQELDNGGYEAILHELLNEDISMFNPRKLPVTSQSFDIKLRSADSPLRYLYEALSRGGFCIAGCKDNEEPMWQDTIPKQSMYDDYCGWCNDNKERPIPQTQFTKQLKKVIPSVQDKRPSGGARHRHYAFKSLYETKADFAASFKEDIHNIFGT